MSQFWCEWWSEVIKTWRLCGELDEEAQVWYSCQVDKFFQEDERDHEFKARWLVWEKREEKKDIQKLLIF